MNRALGEGKVTKLVKKYAYIQDDRLGKVYFPLEAARITIDCVDLREKFNENDIVIFTAQKQASTTNDCQYAASSVIKKKDLIHCYGKITETFDKFCYVDVKKFGKVFVPYSARTEAGKPWLGRGAEKGKTCSIRIFRQPDINTCKYVAFGWKNFVTLHFSISRITTDSTRLQIGCIVRYADANDCLIYSAQTGLARLPANMVRPWMYLGGWLKYDISRDPNSLTNGDPSKSLTTWIVRDPVDLGMLFEVEEDQMDGSRLQLSLNCVVNRVSISNRHAWLWNDFIGRIYVPPGCFRHSLRPMECAKARVVYTGAFDDVPWSALHLEVIGPNDEIRQTNAQLLLTDDNWSITHVQSQQGTFFGFMENPKYGSAFIAWTDLAEGEAVPAKEQRCRATVFKQHREKKHQWRAVLVAPLEDKAASYPLHVHSGVLQIPRPFRAPQQPNTPSPPPPPVQQQPIGTRTSQDRSMASLLRMSSPPGVMGLPMELGLLVKPQSNSTSPITAAKIINGHRAQRLPSLQQICPGSMTGVTNSGVSSSASLPSSSVPTPSITSPSQHLSSEDGSDTFSENHEIDILAAQFGESAFRLRDEFSHWLPPSSVNPPSFMPLSFAPTSSATSPAAAPVPKVDVGTQTDMICEQRVLRDIMQNRELLMKVFEAFPTHMDVILNMKWQTTTS
ncbi:unnamed protein product, partial [Mesorhabditis belari]|uniref:Uncharacterized protein n=1 Tax=Mesorhabditis belari TaxID=2138241 RepID=A0AAF3FHI8_9BILA